MLTKDDLKRIKQVVQGVIKPLDKRVSSMDQRLGGVGKQTASIDLRLESVERKVNSVDLRLGEVKGKVDDLADGIADLKLETKAINTLIADQDKDFRSRIERLEEHAGIVS